LKSKTVTLCLSILLLLLAIAGCGLAKKEKQAADNAESSRLDRITRYALAPRPLRAETAPLKPSEPLLLTVS